MCDAFLVLAQADGGLSCFLLPRFTPDGERNRFHIQRLKDKLGNRSNASSEVEFRGAWARLVGEEGRGVPTIIDMVNHTRLDCVVGVSAGFRWGTAMAIHHASHRSAFGKPLVEQPLMRNVLADLAVESEAATISALWLARAFDEAHAGDERAVELRRLATPVLKYWTCKRAPVHAVEALECLGGNGYVEESGMPRLYRESPLASIWEGSGNVQCLDVLRAMAKNPASVETFFAEIDEARGANAHLDAAAAELREELSDLEAIEARARAGRRVDGAGAPGLASGPLRRSGGRRRVLRPPGWAATPAARSAPCRQGSTSAGSSSATRLPPSQAGDYAGDRSAQARVLDAESTGAFRARGSTVCLLVTDLRTGSWSERAAAWRRPTPWLVQSGTRRQHPRPCRTHQRRHRNATRCRISPHRRRPVAARRRRL